MFRLKHNYLSRDKKQKTFLLVFFLHIIILIVVAIFSDINFSSKKDKPEIIRVKLANFIPPVSNPIIKTKVAYQSKRKNKVFKKKKKKTFKHKKRIKKKKKKKSRKKWKARTVKDILKTQNNLKKNKSTKKRKKKPKTKEKIVSKNKIKVKQEEILQTEKNIYLGKVYSLLYKYWRQPNIKVNNTIPSVTVEITLNKYGKILKAVIIKKSRYNQMNTSVIRLFKTIRMLPKFSGSMHLNSIKFSVSFQLTR